MLNNKQRNQHQHQRLLREGLEEKDLARLVHDELHIDEYRSKMGEDQDLVVVSFKVKGKEPANDVVNFLEKGYDWIIDADVSSGEMEDGDYIVFVELERTPKVPEEIHRMIDDLQNVVDVPIGKWRVRYYKDTKDHPLDIETLKQIVPVTPSAYQQKFGKKEIDDLKVAAGVDVDTKAPKNEYTESLRIAAGII
jgi:hypothetical protein